MEESNKKIRVSGSVYKNRYIILVIVMVGMVMSVLDGYMVTIALPTITTYFNTDITQSQWIITGYLVVMTGLFILFGKLSEYTGKTKLFIAGWTLFTLSSLACGISADINGLIIFRILQAAGASMVAGVSGAIIFHIFPPHEIGRAMGYFGAAVALGSLVGPGLGGLITDTIGWQFIFFVNVPLGIILLVGALKYLQFPEHRSKNLNLDWMGAVTLIISVVSLMLFCGELAKTIALTIPAVTYGIIFALSLIVFILQESRRESPILEISWFKNRKFSLPVVSLLIFSVALNIAIVLGPFYFQGAMGYNPSQVGLIFMTVPLAMMFAAPLGGKLYDKYHSKYAAGIGVLISGISFILLSYAYQIMNLSLVIFSLLLWGVGNGLFTSPNTTETLSALPREKTAIASSVSTTAKSLGGALGVSFATISLTVIFNNVGYNGEVLQAGSALLSSSISTIMFITGVLCVLATITSFLRNMK